MQQTPTTSVADLFGLEPSSFTVTGSEPATTSPHRLAECMAAAMGAHGAAASRLELLRGGRARAISVATEDALLQLMAVFATRVGGVPAADTLEDPGLLGDSDFYRGADGREIFLLLTFPHLRDRALRVLGCPPGREAIAEAVSHWDAFALEDAMLQARATATAVRTREEWAASDAGRALVGTPLVRIERTADAPERPLARLAGDDLPLRGVRVLDLTHVIAGPVASRLLAELGAEVLHVSRPDRADPNAMIIETGVGKRNAFCDLRTEEGRAAFDRALASADVLVHSYRHLDRFGITAEELAARHPGIVVADVHGWGDRGPWAARGGFDQLACAATGFALEEGGDHAALPPTYLLNDYIAAFLLAAGVETTLTRQSMESGSWSVHIDLARVCTWVQSFGANPNQVESAPDLRARLGLVDRTATDGPFGRVEAVTGLLQVEPAWPNRATPSAPLGSAALQW